MQTHRIRQQRWLITAPSQEAAFEVRQQLRMHLDEVVLPAFERAFDALAVGDDIVRLPRLNIHLKIQHQEGQGEAFTTRLAQQLSESLHVALQDMMINPEQQGVSRLSVKAHQHQILLEYLRTGRVEYSQPESHTIADLLRHEAYEWIKAVYEGKPVLSTLLTGDWSARYAVAFRLLTLLEKQECVALLESLYKPGHTLGALPAILPTDSQTVMSELPQILQALIHYTLLDNGLALRVQAAALALKEEDSQVPLASSLHALLQESTVRIRASSAFPQSALLLSRLEILTKIETTPNNIVRSHPNVHVSSLVSDSASLQLAALSLNAAVSNLEYENDGYLAHDAGLVLVHPFLTRFLELRGGIVQLAELEGNERGIAEKGKRQLAEAQLPRAAALLYSVLYGNTAPLEFELTTLKVLLGLSPTEPLLISPGLLSSEDEEAVDQLLTEVISHWSALGKTTINGLRASFLQRQGSLRKIAQGWQLRVEHRGFDLLLGQLPWGMSIVKLPWMPEPIFIEWAAAS